MDIVTVRGLTKTYPGFTLDSVSFSLAAGRIAGFIGRNGAGKTTTIKSMLNLIHPNAGEISYFGMPLADNEARIKQRIGYSTGTIAWYPRKKIRAIKRATERFYDSWNEDTYARYLRLFALDENKCPRELSEGMKVKCNLLFALSHGAEVLILDEPTSGLDPFSRDELLDLFGHIKQAGTAILFSTHIISDIDKSADDIIYISGGKIAAACSKQEFADKSQRPNETLEEAFLRLEKGAHNA
ncbi:MAG: ABC transporter ATP-binding protein [Coriobacteriales bacterium]|nr:ABC transporter ATP-binding protein [Coriobacteriales bacterium]